MPKLSKRAEELLNRLQKGEWYRQYAKNTPAAMQELIDAGLVETAGRMPIIVSCYVPKGYWLEHKEHFPSLIDA
jgi:hypothetical protein